MSNGLLEKEKQVELSRLAHTVLEYELKILKKEEELLRIKEDLETIKNKLEAKKEGK